MKREHDYEWVKKPVTIEAFRWDFEGTQEGKSQSSFPTWFTNALVNHQIKPQPEVNPSSLYITTTEGVMEAQDGDWIIRGVEGEIYPCKHSVFEKTYERPARAKDE